MKVEDMRKRPALFDGTCAVHGEGCQYKAGDEIVRVRVAQFAPVACALEVAE